MKMNYSATGQQLQKLIERYNLQVDLEAGTVVISRRKGSLRAEALCKMLGLKEVPENWVERDGAVRGV
jgi:hypothetical protein